MALMEHSLLGAEDVRAALSALSLRQIERLAELSGVPATTIYKIKRGETVNPGIDTVRKFMPHVEASLLQSA
jgi:transcriptional regulator with XRE-family HTH domain